MSHRSGRALIAPLVALAITATAVGGMLWWAASGAAPDPTTDAVLFEVIQDDFEAAITEPGDMESAENQEIRCEVQSRGAAGSRILWVIDEGSNVKQGDLLVRLDDSALQQELIQYEIQVSQD